MFGIQYETWKKICNLYFSLNSGYKHAHLQWFPFAKLTEKEMKFIASKNFFDTYIQTPSFLLYPQMTHQSENFLQKSDGSFRNSSLISPILYLVLQCIGKEISNSYHDSRPVDVSVFYAGNYPENRVNYKTDYDNFFKLINSYAEDYNYFIKTDIANFFNNISIDILLNRIDSVCNHSGICFSQTTLQIYKAFLLYCGHGHFPLIENSVASSYLSTIVYLDEIDRQLYEYLNTKVEKIQTFKMIRYVDDLYIMISSSADISELTRIYNEIRHEYSSILKECGLTINAQKCGLHHSKDINEELKKSLYHEYFYNIKCNIAKKFDGRLSDFLVSMLYEESLFNGVDNEKYNSNIERFFSSPDIEFTAQEVFNYYVYEDDTALQSTDIQTTILSLLKENNSFIRLDPKRLTIMIMKSKSDSAIRSFLNNLFTRYHTGKWNSYDTTIAISYLIQTKFNHIDLLNIIEKVHPDLYYFYYFSCRSSFVPYLNDSKISALSEAISNDWKACYLYFMYLCEKQKNSHQAAFAYYKNFFDRVTADIDFLCNKTQRLKKPNYKAFYKNKEIKKVYSDIGNSETIIQKAHDIRNENPLSHSSSKLLEKNSTDDLRTSINDLTELLHKKIQSISF